MADFAIFGQVKPIRERGTGRGCLLVHGEKSPWEIWVLYFGGVIPIHRNNHNVQPGNRRRHSEWLDSREIKQ